VYLDICIFIVPCKYTEEDGNKHHFNCHTYPNMKQEGNKHHLHGTNFPVFPFSFICLETWTM